MDLLKFRPRLGRIGDRAKPMLPIERRVPRVALLIDGDNVSSKVLPRVLEQVSRLGKATIKRVYLNVAGGGRTWLNVAPIRAIVPVHVQPVSDGKNAADIALVVDAMDILHSGNADAFVIVSSDADFTHLATRISDTGRKVHGLGTQQTPQAFQRACSSFKLTEELELKGVGGALAASRWMLEPSDAEALLVLAVLRIGGGRDVVPLSDLGNHLRRFEPGFDPRVFRRRTLKELLMSLETMEIVAMPPGFGVRLRIQG